MSLFFISFDFNKFNFSFPKKSETALVINSVIFEDLIQLLKYSDSEITLNELVLNRNNLIINFESEQQRYLNRINNELYKLTGKFGRIFNENNSVFQLTFELTRSLKIENDKEVLTLNMDNISFEKSLIILKSLIENEKIESSLITIQKNELHRYSINVEPVNEKK